MRSTCRRLLVAAGAVLLVTASTLPAAATPTTPASPPVAAHPSSPTTPGSTAAFDPASGLPPAGATVRTAPKTAPHTAPKTAPHTAPKTAPSTGPATARPAAPSPAAATPASVPGAFVALTPARVLDTRSGNGVTRGKVATGHTVSVKVAGRGGVPATGAGAVVLTLTATSVTSTGYVTVFPTGRARPVVSNLNLLRGRTLANLVTIPLAADGTVSLYSGANAPVDLVADVSGYYRAGTPTAAGTLTAVTPSRVVDTRSGLGTTRAPVPTNQSRVVTVAGHGGVPATGARSVVLNVTVVNPAGAGYLTAYPSGTDRPTASNLNFAPGQTLAAQVTVPLGADGRIALYVGARADVLVDVQGWVRSGAVLASGAFRAANPVRLLDTRQDQTPEYGYAAVPAGGTITLSYLGDVPAHAVAAVLLTVTATETRGDGYVTAFPAGRPRPLASNLNFTAGSSVPDAVAVAPGTDGGIELYNGSGGTVELVVDLGGYWLDGSLGAVSGTITGPSGHPLAGVRVFVGYLDTSDVDTGIARAAEFSDVVTDAAGRYVADALDTYTDATLCLSTTHAGPDVGPTGVAGGCGPFGAVSIRAGTLAAGVDHQLVDGGRAVHGRLLGADGAPLAGVPVHIGGTDYGSAESEPVATGSDGSYAVVGLAPDAFLGGLCFGALPASPSAPTGYAAQCEPLSLSGEDASDVTARAAVVVTGRVTDAAGHPLSHVGVTWDVDGYDPDGNGTLLFTGTTGTYRLVVTPGSTGQMTVCFRSREYFSAAIVPGGGTSTTGYLDNCWKNLPMSVGTSGEYTEIPVAPGRTVTGIDATLAPAAALSGQVRRPGGSGVAGVNVVLYGGDDVRGAYVVQQTGADGRYRISALRPGHYTVCFVPTIGAPVPPPTGLLSKCWGEVVSGDAGTPVLLTGGHEVTGISADLDGGGSLAGRITDTTGAPVSGVRVSAGGNATTSAADGSYRLDWLRALPTPVCVYPDGVTGPSPTGYRTQCWGGPNDPLHRTPFVVRVGQTTTADLVLDPAPGVTATVTDAQGDPLADALVVVFPVDDGVGAGQGTTGADGTTVIGPLDPGKYTACVSDTSRTRGAAPGGYLQTCVSPTPTTYTRKVTVPASGTAAVTVTVPVGAGVSGRLTDSAGRPVHGVAVSIDRNGFPQDDDYPATDVDGRFASYGRISGSYTVCFDGGSVDGTDEQFGRTCWKNDPADGSGPGPTPVTLKVGTMKTGIDQVLPTV